MMSYQSIGEPIWPKDDFEARVSSGYKKNAAVYQCVTLIARNVSSVPLYVLEDGIKVTHHPLLTLLDQPNPLQNYVSFCEAVISNLLLAGESFIECVGEPEAAELYTLRPDRISLVLGKNGFPEAYEYRIGLETQRVSIDPITGFSPILHMKLFNPMDDHRGFSPLVPAQKAINLQNATKDHNLSLIQNGARPTGAFVVEGNLSDTQYQQLKEDMRSMEQGGKGKTILLQGGVKWVELGLRPKDMDFEGAKDTYLQEIAAICGIPYTLLPSANATYSNYQEGRIQFWEDTIIPRLEFYIAHLNHWLAPQFGNNVRIAYDIEKIHALVRNREKMWERTNNATCLTINEKRKILGYPPLAGGDVLGGSLFSTSVPKQNKVNE